MAKYNITEKKEKDASYRSLVRVEMVDQLYEKIIQKLIVEKKYRDPEYSAKKLADDLGTNTRYISAVISLRFSQNYSCLVNEYRIKDAMYMLINKQFADMNMEEVSEAVGFANRQSFYAAFFRLHGCSPRQYKLTHQIPDVRDKEEKEKEKALKEKEKAKKAKEKAKAKAKEKAKKEKEKAKAKAIKKSSK